MSLNLAWIPALLVASLVTWSVAAFALTGPTVRDAGAAEGPALYGP